MIPTGPADSVFLALKFKKKITYILALMTETPFTQKFYIQTHISTSYTHLILTVKNTLWMVFPTKSVIFTGKKLTRKDTRFLTI